MVLQSDLFDGARQANVELPPKSTDARTEAPGARPTLAIVEWPTSTDPSCSSAGWQRVATHGARARYGTPDGRAVGALDGDRERRNRSCLKIWAGRRRRSSCDPPCEAGSSRTGVVMSAGRADRSIIEIDMPASEQTTRRDRGLLRIVRPSARRSPRRGMGRRRRPTAGVAAEDSPDATPTPRQPASVQSRFAGMLAPAPGTGARPCCCSRHLVQGGRRRAFKIKQSSCRADEIAVAWQKSRMVDAAS